MIPRGGRRRSFLSLRVKFLGIALGIALGPLVLLGVWQTRGAARSGEQLLHSRLDTALTRISRDVGSRWVRERSALLTIAESPEVHRALTRGGTRSPDSIVVRVSRGAAGIVRSDVQLAVLRDSARRPRWTVASRGDSLILRPLSAVDAAAIAAIDDGGLTISFPVSDGEARDDIGTLEAQLRGTAIIEDGAMNAAGVGAVLAVIARATGASLVPLPFDPGRLATDHFSWTGEEWLAERVELDEPPITLVAAAPIRPFVAPFAQAARAGSWTLATVALAALVLTIVLTGRLTRSLERLASAADAVSRGDLDQHVASAGDDELGRVADAFNAMTENLRETLRRLAQQEAIGAVGELAASIAHEVRNPMSVIRLRLQHAQEQVEAGSPVAQSVSRALQEVDRVERTVAGTLRIAQSGRMELEPMDLRAPIEAAHRTAATEFVKRGAALAPVADGSVPLRVLGNAAAIEQALINVLVNSAQALEPGGRASLEIALTPTHIALTVRDAGRGLDAAQVARAFDPFYSTREEGTGLGLSIVKRILAAHGGTVALESTPGVGTRVRLELPRLGDA